MCPAGSEGASYAMFTTFHNAASNLSSAISTQLLGIWDVSKERLERHELSGMTNLTILTSLVQLSAIAFVGFLPESRDDLFALKEKKFGKSDFAGAVFLSITFLSVFYALVVCFLNIYYPGWMGKA